MLGPQTWPSGVAQYHSGQGLQRTSLTDHVKLHASLPAPLPSSQGPSEDLPGWQRQWVMVVHRLDE